MAAAPGNVRDYVKRGFSVMVQEGAGSAAGFSDHAYRCALRAQRSSSYLEGATNGEDLPAVFSFADTVLCYRCRDAGASIVSREEAFGADVVIKVTECSLSSWIVLLITPVKLLQTLRLHFRSPIHSSLRGSLLCSKAHADPAIPTMHFQVALELPTCVVLPLVPIQV